MMPMPEPKKNKRIAMLGTAYDTKGGISSVVNVYREAGLFERWPIEYIATHRDGSKLQKILQAAKAVGRLSWLIVSRRLSLIHVHMLAQPESFVSLTPIREATAPHVRNRRLCPE